MIEDITIKSETKKKMESLHAPSAGQFQQTLQNPVSLHGVGLHTGKQVTMTM